MMASVDGLDQARFVQRAPAAQEPAPAEALGSKPQQVAPEPPPSGTSTLPPPPDAPLVDAAAANDDDAVASRAPTGQKSEGRFGWLGAAVDTVARSPDMLRTALREGGEAAGGSLAKSVVAFGGSVMTIGDLLGNVASGRALGHGIRESSVEERFVERIDAAGMAKDGERIGNLGGTLERFGLIPPVVGLMVGFGGTLSRIARSPTPASGAGHGSVTGEMDEVLPPGDEGSREVPGIVATLGPQTEGRIPALIDAGATGLRVDTARLGPGETRAQIDSARSAARRAGKDIDIMVDLQDPKIRIGEVAPNTRLDENDTLVLDALLRNDASGTAGRVGIADHAELVEHVEVGDVLAFGIDPIEVEVTEVREHEIETVVRQGGTLKSRDAVKSLLGEPLPTPRLTDRRALMEALAGGADSIALSVQDPDEVIALRNELEDLGFGNTEIVAKIETLEALYDVEDIAAVSDGLMAERGDLSVVVGMYGLLKAQDDIMGAAESAGKPAILANEVMSSMTYGPQPGVADATNVANGVQDGFQILLSDETSVGRNPVDAVQATQDIAVAALESDLSRVVENPQMSDVLATRAPASRSSEAQWIEAGVTVFRVESHQDDFFFAQTVFGVNEAERNTGKNARIMADVDEAALPRRGAKADRVELADLIALPVNDPARITALRSRLNNIAGGNKKQIVAKIGTEQALQRIDEIVAAADMIMVEREDLGRAVGMANLPQAQNLIAAAANAAGKRAIIEGGVLDAMTFGRRPTAAQAVDIGYAIQAGFGGVALSGATAMGSDPLPAIETLLAIARNS